MAGRFAVTPLAPRLTSRSFRQAHNKVIMGNAIPMIIVVMRFALWAFKQAGRQPLFSLFVPAHPILHAKRQRRNGIRGQTPRSASTHRGGSVTLRNKSVFHRDFSARRTSLLGARYPVIVGEILVYARITPARFCSGAITMSWIGRPDTDALDYPQALHSFGKLPHYRQIARPGHGQILQQFPCRCIV
jgi:hypothetical protein